MNVVIILMGFIFFAPRKFEARAKPEDVGLRSWCEGDCSEAVELRRTISIVFPEGWDEGDCSESVEKYCKVFNTPLPKIQKAMEEDSLDLEECFGQNR